MYLYNKNELSRSRLSKVRALRTDIRDWKHYHAVFASGNNNCKLIQSFSLFQNARIAKVFWVTTFVQKRSCHGYGSFHVWKFGDLTTSLGVGFTAQPHTANNVNICCDMNTGHFAVNDDFYELISVRLCIKIHSVFRMFLYPTLNRWYQQIMVIESLIPFSERAIPFV